VVGSALGGGGAIVAMTVGSSVKPAPAGGAGEDKSKGKPLCFVISRIGDESSPDGAVVCGREANGDPLFVARANLNGGLHPGKIRFAFGAAFIGFGGQEVHVNDYEVLTSPVVRA
jgi:Protein of unknown function (DUF3421)